MSQRFLLVVTSKLSTAHVCVSDFGLGAIYILRDTAGEEVSHISRSIAFEGGQGDFVNIQGVTLFSV